MLRPFIKLAFVNYLRQVGCVISEYCNFRFTKTKRINFSRQITRGVINLKK